MGQTVEVIHQRNRMLVKVLWFFFAANQVKFLFDSDPSLWLSGLGVLCLVALTLLAQSPRYAAAAMYVIVATMFAYFALLLFFSPYPVNLVFVWLGLLVSAIYGQYGPVLLASGLSLALVAASFSRIQSAYYPLLEETDLFYLLMFGIFVTGMLLFEIRHRQGMEARIEHLAYHDCLTNLPNRTMFHQLTGPLLARAERKGNQLAVFYMDLDRLKGINDRQGHEAGDQLLRAAASGLRGELRNHDVVSRFGGDEFVAAAEVETAEQAQNIGERLVSACRAFAQDEAAQEPVSLSLGISLFPEHGQDLASLLQAADRAMYRAKAQGGNRWRLYSPGETGPVYPARVEAAQPDPVQ